MPAYSALRAVPPVGDVDSRSTTPASHPEHWNENISTMSWYGLSKRRQPGPLCAVPTISPFAARHCAAPCGCQPVRLVPLKARAVSECGPWARQGAPARMATVHTAIRDRIKLLRSAKASRYIVVIYDFNFSRSANATYAPGM